MRLFYALWPDETTRRTLTPLQAKAQGRKIDSENLHITLAFLGNQNIVDADGKKRAVENICAELRISPKEAIIIGDGANDLQMMKIAGLSVAFHAKPVVRKEANVALNFVGLDGVLALFD